MIDDALALVDSNVIIDIIQRDEQWFEWSVDTLSRHKNVSINPIIYAELCYQKTSAEEVDHLLDVLCLGYNELPREALYIASQAFREYRKKGGSKTAPLADFFIGAHATVIGAPIITRDVVPYRHFFPSVVLISP